MPSRTLIVKLGAIGDVALCARAVQELARSSPEVEPHWLIDSALLPLARKLAPSSVQWHPIDAKKLFKGSVFEKITASLGLIRAAHEVRPDKVLILHRDARYRILLSPFFPGKLKLLERNGGRHELDAYREILGCKARMEKARMDESGPFKESAHFNESGPFKIGILVGGAQNAKTSFLEKRWPLPNLSELIQKILAQSSYRIVLFGAPEDQNLARELLASLESSERIENRVGLLPLEALPDALAELDRFVTVDSGPAHIAAGVMTSPGQRIVALFGPTDPGTWAPRASGHGAVIVLRKDLECSPCYRDDGNFTPCPFRGEDFQKCMKRITASEVLSALSLSASG